MTTNKRTLLVTTALPYANGPIHLGHMVEHIQADIWVRWQKLYGNDCIFICGDDAHGTAIMLSAEKQGITPEELIKRIHTEHTADFQDFAISFDNFYTTHSPENLKFSTEIYQRLWDNGDIETRTITQAYDPVAKIFLPDRYVKGTCPNCKTPDQYGDNCEACGATYAPTELINPISVLSGQAPIQKESLHYFFRLDKYAATLQQWANAKHLQPEITNKLSEWFNSGLQQWDISRDAPYFGFEIPNAPGKYFYVWLDAPIGYMASFKNLCEKRPELVFSDYWGTHANTELYHFIGKDIIYFHALFWPAMLISADYRTPTAIFSHGFLTINGLKMSKSRGTYITARRYLDVLDPEYLRYYFAAKLTSGIDDIDLNMQDFQQRVNADLVGKVVNIASRCASFINKHFAGQLAANIIEPALWQQFVNASAEIAEYYEQRDYHRAVRLIMALADNANQYIDEQKPWAMIKQPEKAAEVQAVCTIGLNLFRLLMLYLQPILPNTAKRSWAFLNIAPLTWQDRLKPLVDHTIKPFEALMQRITNEQMNELFAGQIVNSAT